MTLRLESGELVEVSASTAPEELLAFVDEVALENERIQFEEPLPDALLDAIGTVVAERPGVEVYAYERADPDLAWTARMPALQHLSLQTMRTTSFEPLGALSELRSLRLPDTLTREASLTALAPLVHLEELGVGSHDRGFETVATLPALRHLGLYTSRIRSFEPLAGHPALESFSFGFGRVRDLEPLARIPRLGELRFWRVSRLTDQHAEVLGDLEGLESLAVADQPLLTDLEMLTRAPAPTLRKLELEGLRNLTSAAFLDHLPALEEVTVLDCGAVPEVSPR